MPPRRTATRATARPRKQPRKKPETLRLRSITPALTVGDIHKSIAWYRDVVGFTLGETWEHGGKLAGAELKAGTAFIVLSQDDWAKGRDRVKGEGLRLYLNTSQDVDDVAAAIKARGGTLASEPATQPWGTRTFNLVDPDGFKLTISALS
ncbi:MAG TPA: VOC family protein [Gemmatimonadales bacterium]|nr:VOC family protein [Gemmatimonadales bacterium]